MAVKTKFSKRDFERILSSYEVGTLRSAKPISKGTVQTNYILETSQKKMVLRYYENRSKGYALFESNLIKYLTNKNYPCPDIVPNKQGKTVGIYNTKPFIIFEFVEGKNLEKPKTEQKKQLVKKVAELHILTKDYNPKYRQYRWNYNLSLCSKLAVREAKRIDTYNSRKKLKWFLKELSTIELPTSLPKCICHCDFDFSNILFKGGKFKALLDFDDANYTYRIFDLASLVNPFSKKFDWDTWSSFKKGVDVFDFKEARFIMHEYITHNKITKKERDHFFDILKLRIMFDCLWRFERGKAGDFFEKREIDNLNRLGREAFKKQIFKH